MIGAQPMFTYTVLHTYSLCHICNVTLLYQRPQWCSGLDGGLQIQKSWVLNHFKSKNNFASIMLTEIIS